MLSLGIRSAPTSRQLQIVGLIRESWRTHRRAPSVPELADALGVRSTYTVTTLLESLRRRGLVAWEPTKSRTLIAVDPDGAFRFPPPCPDRYRFPRRRAAC